MATIDSRWLEQFGAAMKHYFAIEVADLGLSETELSWFVDLSPENAALAFGEDYDVQRVDIDWLR